MKLLLRALLPAFLLTGFLGCQPAANPGDGAAEGAYPWQPNRPIQVIVPWAAGGSTDQVIRVLAGEIEHALGTSVVVVNTPGASGSIGTRNALQARANGLTWTSGAASSLGTFRLLGLLDTSLDDWELFLAVANVSILSVPTDSPYQNFGDLLQAMKDNPGKVQIGTAGVASSGHHAIETLAQAADVEYRHVAYPGGNPAVIATVGGEVDATTQLATEQVEMIRGKRLRPLAVLAPEPLEIEGHGTVPPVTEWLPELHYAPNYFGIWVRKDVAPEVIETMKAIWEEHVKNSEALRRYARQQGAFFTPLYGDEAREGVKLKIQEDAWSLFDSGQAKMSPEELNIARPGTKI